jgi:hypothetical protein
MKSILTMLAVALALAGCQTAPVERIVYIHTAVPKEMTEKVKLAPPFAPAPYSVLPWDQKEAVLMDLIQQRTSEVGTCNVRLDGIDLWSLMQSKAYATTP